VERYEVADAILLELFGPIGPPTPESLNAGEQLEADYTTHLRPNEFSFCLEMRPNGSISRCKRTQEILGLEIITYRGFFTLIHPAWWRTFLFFGAATYEAALNLGSKLAGKIASSRAKVPLRTPHGWYWFDQRSYPTSFDSRGLIASHLNIYARDRPFRTNDLNTGTLVIFDERIDPEITRLIQKAAQKRFFAHFLPQLTGALRRNMALYRFALSEHEPHDVTAALVADLSGKFRSQAYEQNTIVSNNRDVLQLTQTEDPENPLGKLKTALELARFLNSLFGVPTKEEMYQLPWT